jgi:ATP-binding cassette subfamily B protein
MATGKEHETGAADPADWGTVRRFLPYLWPAEDKGLRWRIVVSALFVLLAKIVVLTLPFAYAGAVDAMAARGDAALWAALALVIAYAAGRFATVAFDNVRNMVFERVGQDAVRHLTEDVFRRLHRLSLRFHLARRTGEVTKVVERGSKSINTMIYFLLFNIMPTAVELLVVGAVFFVKFGWQIVAATAVTVVSYIWLTRTITEWRTTMTNNNPSMRTRRTGPRSAASCRICGLRAGPTCAGESPSPACSCCSPSWSCWRCRSLTPGRSTRWPPRAMPRCGSRWRW